MLRALPLVCGLTLALACGGSKPDAKPDAKRDVEVDTEPKPQPEVRVEAGGKVEILVDGQGYHPAEIHAPANAAITLTFTRPDANNCGEELVIASLDLRKDLPVGQTTEIAITTPATGELGFACGMDMYKGKIVVDP